MMKSRHMWYDQLNNLMDTVIRNTEIRAMWSGLEYTNLSYKEKIDIIKSKYNISDKLVESIIARDTNQPIAPKAR